MSIKKMNIRIDQDGKTEIRVLGGQGEECLNFTRAMEQVLGTVEHRELRPEYYEGDPLAVQTREEVRQRETL